MKLTWLGHACFALEAEGFRIVTDPFEGVPGLKDTHTWANAVYCSHGHHDHHYLEGVEIHRGGENPFVIDQVECFHDEKRGALRGENTIRSFRAQGLQVVHLGDLGHALSQEQAEPLRGCDVLLIPVGGTYTIDGAMAARTVVQLEPRMVVPMHYRNERFGFDDISTVEPFLAALEGYEIVKTAESCLDIHKDGEKQVVLLVPQE